MLLCLLYAAALFYGKALAHYVFDIPHIDNVDRTIPFALLEISIALLPVFALMLVNPLARPGFVLTITRSQQRAMTSIALLVSFGLFALAFASRGDAALHDFYGNRLFIEHGALAPMTIVAPTYIIGTTVVLGFSKSRFAFLPVLVICLVWGVLLSKGFMLAYPLITYLAIRTTQRQRSILPLIVVALAGLVAVVVLGRLRAGTAADNILSGEGLMFLLRLMLYRIDQLDSFALVLEHGRLAYSSSLAHQMINSASYLLPRGVLSDKPLSFSMEMTKLLRPDVFATDAANNFTVFAQTYILGGHYGPVLAASIFLVFFVVMALLQRCLFRSSVEFWTFSIAVLIPCFMSLISAGLFTDYLLLQLPLSLIGLLIFRCHFRAPWKW
jgi:hypothetical protein